MRFRVGLELEDVPLLVQPHAHLTLGIHEELRVVRVRFLHHYPLKPHLLGMELCLEVGPQVSVGRMDSTGETAIGTVGGAERGMNPTLSVGMRGVRSTHTLCRGHR